MNKSLKRKIENITYYTGLLVSFIGIYLSFKSRQGLPEGACPIDNYRWILITGIVLFVISLLFSFGNKEEKKSN